MENLRKIATEHGWDVVDGLERVLKHLQREGDATQWIEQEQRKRRCRWLKEHWNQAHHRYLLILRSPVAAKSGLSLKMDESLWMRLGDFYTAFPKFVNASAWEEECRCIADSIRQFGQTVRVASSQSRNEFEGILFIAGILRDEWKGRSMAASVDDVAAIAPQMGNGLRILHESRIVRREVCRAFNGHIIMEPRSGMDRSELAAFVLRALQSVDWEDSADHFLSDMCRFIDAVREALPRAIRPVSGELAPHFCEMPPWGPSAIFLLTMPATLESSRLKRYWIAEQWGGRWLGPRAQCRSASSSTTPFDALLAMDDEYRVSRPGSGQTRKPGSHRDGTGHR